MSPLCRPVQFSNSLGKLQAITVKAPRKIIDVGVVNADAASASSSESRNYKSTLLEIERLYAAAIEVEDCEKKLAALPTGTALHGQVQEEKVREKIIIADSRIPAFAFIL